MKLDGYDDVNNVTPDMVNNACYLNQGIAIV
jgi:hypothetical protein